VTGLHAKEQMRCQFLPFPRVSIRSVRPRLYVSVWSGLVVFVIVIDGWTRARGCGTGALLLLAELFILSLSFDTVLMIF
jgi:hypothetical protein